MVSDIIPQTGAAHGMTDIPAAVSEPLGGLSGGSASCGGLRAGQATARLWFYIASLAGGGAERVFVRLANHFVAHGQPVRLVVNRAEGPIAALLDPRVDLHVLGVRRAHAALPRLAALLRRDRPEALISALTTTNLVAIAAVRAAGIFAPRARLLVCERNQFSTTSARMIRPKRVLVRWAVRHGYPLADAISGNADGVVEDLALRTGLARNRLVMVPNPAPEAAQIAAARAAPPPHPWLAGPESGPVAVAMGRLVAQKDYPTLLQALAACPPALRLIVLGEGPEEARLKALAARLGLAGRVDFVGFRMNRFDYLVRASVYVLSSRTEGFPNALIEAVACGVPCVATDCAGAGPRQILGAALPEALVAVGDSAAMARAMTQMCTAPPPAAQIEAIAAPYRIEAIARNFHDMVLS